MRCKKIRRKLSAYLDGELDNQEKEYISKHFVICQRCWQEFSQLSTQDQLIRQEAAIEPSPYFRTQFWQKLEGVQRAEKIAASLSLPRWIPLPFLASLFILVFLGFSVITPVFSRNKEAKQAVNFLVQDVFLGFACNRVIAPLNFTDFCDQYCQVLCKCLLAKKHECDGKCLITKEKMK